ncbi:hypothetical protein HELRODRAFT_163454 [Helobdella robusta]|uniref:Uncharacterized protein n=1 Tax=Helobdella robusta TaxID=6412 RepID=T1EU26_HELRO|nr:hypothetical protein HELRODRAFT_163454 [Helobdella robusta]ESN96393.1 hypothetical protein HELRODRAFT_163454 [Helobdella robusta]
MVFCQEPLERNKSRIDGLKSRKVNILRARDVRVTSTLFVIFRIEKPQVLGLSSFMKSSSGQKTNSYNEQQYTLAMQALVFLCLLILKTKQVEFCILRKIRLALELLVLKCFFNPYTSFFIWHPQDNIEN